MAGSFKKALNAKSDQRISDLASTNIVIQLNFTLYLESENLTRMYKAIRKLVPPQLLLALLKN